MSLSRAERLRALVLLSFGTSAPLAAIAAESSDRGVLEEVVVTAQRRNESAQSVAIAVTALNGEELDDKAVVRLDDLQFASPALTITDAGLTRSVNIRGIGLASGSPAVTAGVATYVDGVFQPPIASGTAFYDIATVEVHSIRGTSKLMGPISPTGNT